MFGIGFWEFIVIAVIAIVVLGPDKFPEAMVKVVKIFKSLSKTLSEAKRSVEEELNLQELKEDADKYRALLQRNTKEIKKSISFDELETLKSSTKEVNSAIEEIKKEATQNEKIEDASNKENK
jgi:sec-independent protein translocase protein TatB